jgi:hypothetical protein
MDRIVELVERLEREPASLVRDQARELVSEVLAFHGEALRRLVAVVEKHDAGAIAAAATDPLVASLFQLHEVEVAEREVLLPAAQLVRKPALALATTEVAPPGHADTACDLCAQPAGAEHGHLLDVESRAISCACLACKLALSSNPTGRHRAIPTNVHRVDIGAEDVWWRGLGLPVGLAFFVVHDNGSRASAHYPGPAGTTESTLPVESWRAFATQHAVIASMESDVHALLVDRSNGASEHWVVGIDRCYALVERLRRHWRGLTGGPEARAELGRFFAELRADQGAPS